MKEINGFSIIKILFSFYYYMCYLIQFFGTLSHIFFVKVYYDLIETTFRTPTVNEMTQTTHQTV